MNRDYLMQGLRFALKYEITKKELYVLLYFFRNKKAYTLTELANVLEYNKTSLHHILHMLKLKKLIYILNTEDKSINYHLNEETVLSFR